ncbi:mitochondrial import receptor subunit TOM6 homolog [Saccoglossus kowalevskii]
MKMAPEKKALPSTGPQKPSMTAAIADLYKNPTKRAFIRNLLLFGCGIWLAREFADIDVMAPAQP